MILIKIELLKNKRKSVVRLIKIYIYIYIYREREREREREVQVTLDVTSK